MFICRMMFRALSPNKRNTGTRSGNCTLADHRNERDLNREEFPCGIRTIFRHAASCEFFNPQYSIRSMFFLSHTSSNNSLGHPCPPAAVTRPLVHVQVYQENWRLLLSFNTRRHLVCVFSLLSCGSNIIPSDM